ncbi:MAG: radical SAM protein [Acidilobaceae archaeon]
MRRAWRHKLGLGEDAPRDSASKPCPICVNECRIGVGERGFCGVWVNRSGRLEYIVERGVLAETYYDPHPTNCVAAPICPATTRRGFPDYTPTEGLEYGYYNLAVFMGGCSLDCLFCQNWSHRVLASRASRVKDYESLVLEALDPRVTCVCYFGGDPVPHLPLLIRVSKEILDKSRDRGQRYKRICWETNGLMNPVLAREMSILSLKSGGIVKIDWKAWTPSVYEALTGVDGERALTRLKENAKLIASIGRERPEPPLLVVSVLLVPGYVTPEEVSRIAEYIASLDDRIPMVLLAFHPDYIMTDLPPTSSRHVEEAVREARRVGIKEIYVGNEWLLGDYY